MTTPQSLTEEDLRLLESLPIKAGWDEYRSEKWEALRKAQLINLVPASVLPSKEQEIWAHPNVGPMLATLQAERERERERVNGLAAKLGFQIETVADGLSGAQTADSLETAAEYATLARMNLTSLSKRVKEIAANPEALSPDVLGDQKDKGKATDYADSKESGSVTNEGQVGSPEAAGKLTFTMHKANAEALAEAGRDLAAIWRWVTGTYTVNADLITGGVEAITEVLGGDSELCQPMSDEVIAQIRERLFGLPENEPATSLSRPDAVSVPKKEPLATPKVEDSVVEVGGDA